MFNKNLIFNRTCYVSNNWKKSLRNREIAKNNYRLSGDMKKAKAFVKLIQNRSIVKNNPSLTFFETVIYSRDTLSVAHLSKRASDLLYAKLFKDYMYIINEKSLLNWV